MDFSAGGTCPCVRTPKCGLKTCAQTLPTWQECLFHEVPSGAVARVCGCARMCGCAEESTGVDEIGCTEDWAI